MPKVNFTAVFFEECDYQFYCNSQHISLLVSTLFLPSSQQKMVKDMYIQLLPPISDSGNAITFVRLSVRPSVSMLSFKPTDRCVILPSAAALCGLSELWFATQTA